MKRWSRREVLKTGMAVPAASAIGMPAITAAAQPAAEQAGIAPALRERSLLDFGWRFHFGHANDSAKDFGFGGGGAMGEFQKTGNFLSPSHIELRRQRLEDRRPAARLGHRTALPERSGALEQGLLPARAQVPGDQRGLVPARLRPAGRGRGPAHLSRVRRRLPRGHGGLQRLLHRHAQRRLRSVQLRPHRFRDPRRAPTSCWCAWTPPRATAGSTRARESTVTSGW